MTDEEIKKRISEIDKERERLKQEKEEYLRHFAVVELENKYKEHKKYIGNCYIATKYREKYPYIIAFKIIDVPNSKSQDEAVCITLSDNNVSKRLSISNETLRLWTQDKSTLVPIQNCLYVIDKYKQIPVEEFDEMLNNHFQKILDNGKHGLWRQS